jgi:hypothetical protein
VYDKLYEKSRSSYSVSLNPVAAQLLEGVKIYYQVIGRSDVNHGEFTTPQGQPLLRNQSLASLDGCDLSNGLNYLVRFFQDKTAKC